MRAFLLYCGIIVGFHWVGGLSKPIEVSARQEQDKQRAQRLWEQVIAAKGGRERLSGVRNMVVSHGGHWNVTVYGFPNKVWQWSDDRPTRLGLSVEMHNLERRLAYSVTDKSSGPPINGGFGSNVFRGVPELRDGQLYYLLETPWIKPVPLTVSIGRVGQKQTDVIETMVNGLRVDFHLDPESHLPLEVVFPSHDSIGSKYGRGTYYVTFSDYREVSGIQMPHQVGFRTEKKVPTTFEINVDYDEQIFERPPNIADGPDAWRRKSSRSARK